MKKKRKSAGISSAADMSRVKRVRFAEPDRVFEGCCQQDAYVDPVESSVPQNFDKAKTSEYKYYQELRQAAGHKVHSHLSHKPDKHLNNNKADNSDGFKTSASEKSGLNFHLCLANKQDSNTKKIDFSMGVDDSGTSSYQYLKKFKEDSFHNLLFHPSHAQNHLKKTAASNCTVELCDLIRQNSEVWKLRSPTYKATPIEPTSLAARPLRNSELQYGHGEVFPRKRQKLLKLAAEVLSLDADEFSSNRSNLLAKFLQRLGIEHNNSGLLRFKQREFDISSTKLSYPESSTHVQEVPGTTKTYLMPSTTTGIKGRGLRECWVEGNNLIFLQGKDLDGHHYSAESDCSYWADSSHETSPPYRSNRSDNALDSVKTTNWQIKSSILGSDLSTESSLSGNGCLMLESYPVEFDNPVNKILPSPSYPLKDAIASGNSPCFRKQDENYGYSYQVDSSHETSPLYRSNRSDNAIDSGKTTNRQIKRSSVVGSDLSTESSLRGNGCLVLENHPLEFDNPVNKILTSPSYPLKHAIATGNSPSFRKLDENYGCSYWANISHETSPLYSNRSGSVKTTNWQIKRSSIVGSDLSTESSLSGNGCLILENYPVVFDNPVNKVLPSPSYPLKHSIAPSNSPCFTELDENYSLHEPELVRKKSPLLLDGKDGILVNEPGLFVSCQRVSEALNPIVYNHWNSDCNFDEAISWYPSFFPNKQPLNSTLQELLVDWIPNSAAGKCIMSDPSFLLEESEGYPLISSDALHNLTSTEGSGLSDNYKESDHCNFVHESFQGKLCSSLPPPSVDLNVRWKGSSRNVCFNDDYLLTHTRLQFCNNEEDMSKSKQTGNELHSFLTWSTNESSIYNISHQSSLYKESLLLNSPPPSLDLSVRWKGSSRNVCFNDNYPLPHARLQFHNNEEDMSNSKQTGNELHSFHTWSTNESSICNISHQSSLYKESLFPIAS